MTIAGGSNMTKVNIPAQANLHPVTEADNPRCLAVCFTNGGLLFHNQRNDAEWIACSDPIDTIEWK